MLHLVKAAVNPALTLRQCVENWHDISCSLREAPRERCLQVEKFDAES
jgi:hypothetical protein